VSREDLFSEPNCPREGEGSPLEHAQRERHPTRIDDRLRERGREVRRPIVTRAYSSQERVSEGRRFQRLLTRLLTRPCFFRGKVVEALGIEPRSENASHAHLRT
jgi:hypothetical protein